MKFVSFPKNVCYRFGSWLGKTSAQKIDGFSRKSIGPQISILFVVILVVYLLLWVLWLAVEALNGGCEHLPMKPGEVYKSFYNLFVQSVNPSPEQDSALMCVMAVIVFFVGSLLVVGVLITSMVNWMDRRKEKWLDGDINYDIKKNFTLIIGGHRMVPSLCRQVTERDRSDFEKYRKYIVIQTKLSASVLRKDIESKVERKFWDRIVIYRGDRASEQDLRVLNAECATEIYIIGENRDIDRDDHDTFNLQCYTHLKEIVTAAKQHGAKLDGLSQGQKTPCHIMFAYQSSFHVFQFTDMSPEDSYLDFIPFNYFRVWAQQVLVNGRTQQAQSGDSVQDVVYTPLDGKGITADSKQFVHLIVVGMSKMGTAMAVEAAHLCHYPNFITQGHHPRTRITFIDRNAQSKMNFFQGRYRTMFQMARWRFARLTNEPDCRYVAPSWIDPMTDADSRSPYVNPGEMVDNFIDVEWEFIEGEISSPGVADYLSMAALEEQAITTVAICLPVTAEAISAALYLPAEMYRSEHVIQILVQQQCNDALIRSINSKKLKPFGMLSDCNYLALFANKIPPVVAYLYHHGPEAMMEARLADVDHAYKFANQEWDSATAANGKSVVSQKISSYCHAEMIGPKQRSFGIQAEDKLLVVEQHKQSPNRIVVAPELLDLIAKVEHNRWNVEQLLVGYRPLTTVERAQLNALDKNGEQYKIKKAELKRMRAHPDLTAWEHLEENSKVYDRDMSSALPVLLKILESENMGEG